MKHNVWKLLLLWDTECRLFAVIKIKWMMFILSSFVLSCVSLILETKKCFQQTSLRISFTKEKAGITVSALCVMAPMFLSLFCFLFQSGLHLALSLVRCLTVFIFSVFSFEFVYLYLVQNHKHVLMVADSNWNWFMSEIRKSFYRFYVAIWISCILSLYTQVTSRPSMFFCSPVLGLLPYCVHLSRV